MRRTTFLLIRLVVSLSFGLPGCGGSESAAPGGVSSDTAAPGENAQPVTLVIELEAGPRTFEDIPWSSGMTVLQVMESAEDGEGKLSFDYAGRGERAMLSAIAGVESEGAGRGAKNWLYWVDDTFAARSFAVATVEAGQTVTWRLAPYDAASE